MNDWLSSSAHSRIQGLDEPDGFVVEFPSTDKPTCPCCTNRVKAPKKGRRRMNANAAILPPDAEAPVIDLAARKAELRAKVGQTKDIASWSEEKTLQHMVYAKKNIKVVQDKLEWWLRRQIRLENRLVALGVPLPAESDLSASSESASESASSESVSQSAPAECAPESVPTECASECAPAESVSSGAPDVPLTGFGAVVAVAWQTAQQVAVSAETTAETTAETQAETPESTPESSKKSRKSRH